MAFRWSKGFSPLQAIKRGMTSLFVCAVVLFPLIGIGLQLKGWFTDNDPRQATALAALQVRPIDQSGAAIKPFEQPLITVTFDDGWETIYSQGMPLLQRYGIPTTQYVLSGTDSDIQYMTFDQMTAMRKAGHELACHSIDHSNLTLLTKDSLNMQLTSCKSTVEAKTGFKVNDFASPFGASNTETITAIKQTYRSHRNTAGDIVNNAIDDQDVNTKANFDRYNIIAVTLRRDTTDAQLQAAIDYAVKNNGWLVLNYHQVDDGTSQYGLDFNQLEKHLQVINKAPARVVTIGQALNALGY